MLWKNQALVLTLQRKVEGGKSMEPRCILDQYYFMPS